MVDKHKLTEGALAIIMRGGEIDNPIMQVLGSKRIVSGSTDKERFRILLSDGKYLISFAMLTTQVNDTIMTGEIPIYSIIKLKKFITSVIQNTGSNKRILVILDMETMIPGSEVGDRIGSPEQLPDDLLDIKPVENGGKKEKNNSGPPPAKKPHLSSTASSSNNANTSMNQTLNEQLVHPISSLSPYQNKWVIKVRVTSKSQIRTWSNSKGEGKLFSMDLLDASGEIRATVFKEMVDKFYDFIKVDKVYYISKCQLKMANKQYSSLKNDYEMTFHNDTVVQECFDDVDEMPTTQFNFLSIDKISSVAVGTVIDVIGVCKQASEIQTFTAKSTGNELKKRELVLVDQSKTAVSLTLWGKDAESYNQETPVVVIKGAKVGEFGGGINISAPGSATIKYDPDIPEACVIRAWYDKGGNREEAASISSRNDSSSWSTKWLSFKDVIDQGLGNSEKGDYYCTKGTVLLFRSENCFYKACPEEGCNKKVIDMENGQYRCEKCKTEYSNFKFRLLGSMNIGDWSGNQWISMFSSEVEKILNMTSQEVGDKVTANPDSISDIANEANFKQYIFKCRAKMETYNDEARLKTVAVKVDPINHKEYNSHLITQIQQLTEAL